MLPIQKVKSYLNGISNFGFTGTVLIASGNEILHTEGYGFADKEKGIQNTTKTFHDIGSITKQFTAAGILKLEMEGLVNINDPFDKYLHHVPVDKKNISLHQLLTHTSGIYDSSLDDYDIVSKEKAVQGILSSPLNAPNSFRYSNDGYTLLAAIIESVSGQSYEEFIYHHLFRPSNMDETGYTIPEFDADKVANGYVDGQNLGKPTEKNYPFWNLMGNGGMLSTAGDLFKWHCSLLEDKILSKEAKQKLFTPYLRDYAYGWYVYDSPFGKVIEHGGASSYGTCAKLTRYTDKNLVIIVLCNQFSIIGNQMAKVVSEKISNLLFGITVQMPPMFSKQYKEGQQTIIPNGTYQYQLTTGGMFELYSQDEKITLSSYSQDCINMLIGMEEKFDYFHTITNLSLEIIKDIMVGNYSSLEARMENLEGFEERKNLIESKFRQGDILEEIKPIGTFPSNFKPGTIEVRIHIRFDNHEMNLLFFWENHNIQFLGFIGDLGPLSLDFIRNDQDYIGYSIVFESIVSFSFHQGKSDKIKFLTSSNTAFLVPTTW
jgi:CubicO group peptidase (beta-lactamase class C family)